jgi:hypothetical protein
VGHYQVRGLRVFALRQCSIRAVNRRQGREARGKSVKTGPPNTVGCVPRCAQRGHDAPITGERPVMRLVRDDDQFEAVIVPSRAVVAGTHELRYLWNRRPFISRVFQRGNLDALLTYVRQLRDELVERG